MSTTAEELSQVPTRETDEAPKQSAEEAPLITEEGAEQETAAPPSEQPRRNDPEKRIGQYRARLARAEEQRDYWRDQAQRASQPRAPEPQVEPEPVPPKVADFQGDYEKFAEAQTQYVKDVRAYDRRQVQVAEDRRRQEQERSTRQAQLTERQQKQVDMLQGGQGRYEDFELVVYDPELKISTQMLDIATDMENGADVLYALGQKPKDAARIAGMRGQQAVIAMAQFAANIGSTPKGSGAPPPPKPAKGGGDTSRVDEDKLTAEEAIRRDRERRFKIGRS